MASFTRAIGEENESLPTSFIGWAKGGQRLHGDAQFRVRIARRLEGNHAIRALPNLPIQVQQWPANAPDLENGRALRAVNRAPEI